MAETNSPRLNLRRWSASSDTPSRTEFDDSFASLENLVAIDKQGNAGSLPAAGVRGTYHWDTDNELLRRDTGAAWFVVGSKGRDGYFKSSTTASVPFTVDSPTSQSANLFDLKVDGVAVASVSAAGSFSGNVFSGKSAAFNNDTNGNVVLAAKGSAGQTANLFELKNNANAVQMSVSNTGVVQSSFMRTGTTSTLNASSSSNVANMAYWSGTPMFEVRSNVAGTGAFNEFAYLKREAVGGDAVSRRFGLVMKVGDEDASGATRSAALYLQSLAANMSNPTFRIDVRDVTIWDMNPTAGSITTVPVWANGSYMRATPGGTTGAFRASNAWIGTQNSGDTMYFRSGSNTNGFYWYGGGVHSETSGDAGSGGQMYAVLSPSAGGSGKLTLGRLQLTDLVDADNSTSSPTFQIGLSNAHHLQMDGDEIMAVNNGSFTGAQLALQYGGGTLVLGSDSTKVKVNDHVLWLSTDGSAPPNPVFGDVWIDIRFGQGLKYRDGSNQWTKLG
jgi:hypothetical protein